MKSLVEVAKYWPDDIEFNDDHAYELIKRLGNKKKRPYHMRIRVKVELHKLGAYKDKDVNEQCRT